MGLAIREHHYGKNLDSDLQKELRLFYATLSTADIRFYTSLIDHKVQTVTVHPCVQIHHDPCECFSMLILSPVVWSAIAVGQDQAMPESSACIAIGLQP